MSFLEVQFPPRISFGATGGPRFQTEIGTLDSGVESRTQGWSQALARYDVSHAARKKDNFDILLAFFLSVKGRAHGFRFKDWTDYQATSSQGIFAMLTSTTFQMYKRYTFGSLTYERKITKPVAGTTVVTGGSSPSVSTTTGIVTVSSGTPTAHSTEFDVPCRFDTDSIEAEIINRSSTGFIMGWRSIPIVEIRL